MNYSVVFVLIVLLKFNSAVPQRQQSQLNVDHKSNSGQSEAMTAAAVNSGISVANGFLSIFQTMLNNFWTTIPTIVTLFAPPTAANVPAVAGAGGTIANNLPNPLNVGNGQYGGPIRQMKANTDQSNSELIEIIDDNIETFPNNVRVWEIRGATTRK